MCSQKKAEAAQLEAEFQEEMSRRRQLKADMEKATNILRRAVMVRTQLDNNYGL